MRASQDDRCKSHKSPEGHLIESKLVSRTTTKIVNLDHTREFQECMDSYEIGNGYIHLTLLLWLLGFMNALAMFFLLLQRVLHTIIGNIPANNTQDVLFVFHLVVTAVLDCYT